MQTPNSQGVLQNKKPAYIPLGIGLDTSTVERDTHIGDVLAHRYLAKDKASLYSSPFTRPIG